MKRTSILYLILATLMTLCMLTACSNENSVETPESEITTESKITTLKDKVFVCASCTSTIQYPNSLIEAGHNDGNPYTKKIYTYRNYIYYKGISDNVVIEYHYDDENYDTARYIDKSLTYYINDNTITFLNSNGITYETAIVNSSTSFTISGYTSIAEGCNIIVSDQTFTEGTTPPWGIHETDYQ